jgi:hypothetical protein
VKKWVKSVCCGLEEKNEKENKNKNKNKNKMFLYHFALPTKSKKEGFGTLQGPNRVCLKCA